MVLHMVYSPIMNIFVEVTLKRNRFRSKEDKKKMTLEVANNVSSTRKKTFIVNFDQVNMKTNIPHTYYPVRNNICI